VTTDELVKQLKADVAIQIAVALARSPISAVVTPFNSAAMSLLAGRANDAAEALVEDQVRRGWIPTQAPRPEPGSVEWLEAP
jgi:hypothetical protein